MYLKQLLNTLGQIRENKNINRPYSVYKHFLWQGRKILNLYPFRLRISTSQMWANDKSCGVSALVNCMGMYDINNMSLVKLLFQQKGVFFDIGANIGVYSLIASEQANAKVYSFEPHPRTYTRLRENIKLNDRNNIVALNMALGSVNKEIGFTNYAKSTLNHITNSSGDGINVKCMRMDDFCKEENIIPDFVKIDVEGFEHDVLKGFGDILKNVKILFVEINGLSESRAVGEEDTIKLLESNGFAGPFSFDIKTMTLDTNKNNKEDPVFILKKFIPELKKNDFTIRL